jgi:hypothetical protein
MFFKAGGFLFICIIFVMDFYLSDIDLAMPLCFTGNEQVIVIRNTSCISKFIT